MDQQWNWRENQALARRLKSAKLRHNICIEDIDYRAARGLEKTVIRGLAKDSQWVQNHENLFVLGPTGVGKSFIACALAQKACRDGYSAFYTRAAALFRDLALARADGSFRNLLARFSRIDVLVIDDWAMALLSEPERRDFWEICEDRYQVRSLILTGLLGESGFVLEEDPGMSASSVFFNSGQRVVFQYSTCSASRSLACRSGFCTLHCIAPSIFPDVTRVITHPGDSFDHHGYMGETSTDPR